MNNEVLRIGTRGSPLAMVQARDVQSRLQSQGWKTEVVVIRTHGDLDLQRPLTQIGGSGVFVKEIEHALLDNHIDLAVHCLKDVPQCMPAGLKFCAFLERESPLDALIANCSLQNLEVGSVVGTGSPRRVLQLRALRKDLQFRDVRGNLGARIARVENKEMGGLVLALAGLRRLGIAQRACEIFSPDDFVPAICQGVVAVQCRINYALSDELGKTLDHNLTRQAVVLERGFMEILGGGCRVPMGALAQKEPQGWSMRVMLANPRSSALWKDKFYLQEPNIESLEFKEIIQTVRRQCKLKEIPMPDQVAEHDLMHFWGANP